MSATAAESPAALKARVLAELEQHPYRPPAWLRWKHGQTVWAPFFRYEPEPAYELVRLDTPDDDFLRVHRLHGNPDAPTALLLHGLEGCARSKYIMGLGNRFHAQGWNVAALEFRSCGGEMNRARRMYHSGETTDLAFVVDWLAAERPDARIYIAGVSLGGNVTAKWLGESADAVPKNVAGGAVVCSPYDLLRSGPYVDHVLGGAYVKHFLRTLIPKAIEKEKQYPGCVDIERVKQARTFEDFDNWATAVLHGFDDAQDYWRRVACGQFLHHVRTPLMLLSAADDPFNPADTFPHETAAASDYLIPQFMEQGGHVGFVEGTPARPTYWAEEHVVRYFTTLDAAVFP
jgi:uncharacterized protein